MFIFTRKRWLYPDFIVSRSWNLVLTESRDKKMEKYDYNIGETSGQNRVNVSFLETSKAKDDNRGVLSRAPEIYVEIIDLRHSPRIHQLTLIANVYRQWA